MIGCAACLRCIAALAAGLALLPSLFAQPRRSARLLCPVSCPNRCLPAAARPRRIHIAKSIIASALPRKALPLITKSIPLSFPRFFSLRSNCRDCCSRCTIPARIPNVNLNFDCCSMRAALVPAKNICKMKRALRVLIFGPGIAHRLTRSLAPLIPRSLAPWLPAFPPSLDRPGNLAATAVAFCRFADDFDGRSLSTSGCLVRRFAGRHQVAQSRLKPTF